MTYTYECEACQHLFDTQQSMNDATMDIINDIGAFITRHSITGRCMAVWATPDNTGTK